MEQIDDRCNNIIIKLYNTTESKSIYPLLIQLYDLNPTFNKCNIPRSLMAHLKYLFNRKTIDNISYHDLVSYKLLFSNDLKKYIKSYLSISNKNQFQRILKWALRLELDFSREYPRAWRKLCKDLRSDGKELTQLKACPQYCRWADEDSKIIPTYKLVSLYRDSQNKNCRWSTPQFKRFNSMCHIIKSDIDLDPFRPIMRSMYYELLPVMNKCPWFNDWNKQYEYEHQLLCNRLRNTFNGNNIINIYTQAKNEECKWIDDVRDKIKNIIKSSLSYSAHVSYGILYTIYLAIKSNNACSIYSIINSSQSSFQSPSHSPSIGLITWNINTTNPSNSYLLIPRELWANIDRCQRRFVIIPIILIDKINDSHLNAGVYDIKNKTFERFEPYGYHASYYLASELLDEQLTKVCALHDIRYIKPLDFCPEIGPQFIEVNILKTFDISRNGFCQIWSLWFFDMRINNPDISSKLLIESFISKSQSNIIELLLQFITEYYHIINNLYNELIIKHLDKYSNIYSIIPWIENNYIILITAMKEYLKYGKVIRPYVIKNVISSTNNELLIIFDHQLLLSGYYDEVINDIRNTIKNISGLMIKDVYIRESPDRLSIYVIIIFLVHGTLNQQIIRNIKQRLLRFNNYDLFLEWQDPTNLKFIIDNTIKSSAHISLI